MGKGPQLSLLTAGSGASGYFQCHGSILFQPNLANSNLQPEAALISTVGKPSSCGPQTTFTVNHKPQSNFYEFQGFVEVNL